MGDVRHHQTVVPLLNSYKHGLVARRLLGTATGGIKLNSWRLNLLQLSLYLSPVILALPFIVLDALGTWIDYYIAAVYAIVHTLAVFAVRLTLHCVRCSTPHQERELDDIEITSFCSRNSHSFVFSSKHIASVFIHCLVVCAVLSFSLALVLLPRPLSTHLPLPGAVVVGIIGWLVVLCGSHYSLCVSQPHEVAVYRPTDVLELGPLTRAAFCILCGSAIITVRLSVSDTNTVDLAVQLLYVALCLLPLCWVVGCLPPLDALLPWAMEQVLTRFMEGSHMATDLRLLIMFLVSLVSTVVVAIAAHYSSFTAALLLATVSGYLLSHNLFSITLTFTCLRESNTHSVQWKSFTRSLLLHCLRGFALTTVSILIVYFSSTAKKDTRMVAGTVLGSCVIALSLVLSTTTAGQSVYILGLFRNPLHPWRLDNLERYKTWRRRLSYCSVPTQLALTYVSPLLMLGFLSVNVESDAAPCQWLRALAMARILRKVWQNTWSAQLEVSVVFLLQLALPENTVWVEFGLQSLIVGFTLDVCREFFLKLRFGISLFIKFLTRDRKKIQRWVFISIAIGTPLLLPLQLAIVLLSALVSAPILPLFTLPIFLPSFPRTLRFWPSFTNYGDSYCNCSDSVYYQHDATLLSRALLDVFSTGSASGQPGDTYLLRCQDRTVIATVLESGHRFYTLNLRGLEIEETSCHTTEAAKIDEIFSQTYNSTNISFWFNCHPLCTLTPVDSAVVHTYSSSRIVLTGIIDQPRGLERFSGNLLKCIVWVLHRYCVSEHPHRARGLGERRGSDCEVVGAQKHRVKWRGGRNKIVPVIDSDSLEEEQCRQTGGRDGASKTVTVELRESNSRHNRPSVDPMSGLIPVDIPLQTDRGTINHISTPGETSNRQQLPYPAEWLVFPLTDSQLDNLLSSFPTEWLSFISSTQQPISGGTLSLLAFKRLCLMCFSTADVPQSSRGRAHTRPHHIHSGFNGELPYSLTRDWLVQRPTLHQLILNAYRYAVKLLCDEAALGEAGDSAELSEYLQNYHNHYHIGREGGPDWNSAVLDHKPNLFSIWKSQDNDTYGALVLTLQEELVHIGQLNSEGVRAVWNDLGLELLYLTNDDDERYSIQAHTWLLRNLTIQAADPPLGYPVYSSHIITIHPSI